jgi:hypothetical protein
MKRIYILLVCLSLLPISSFGSIEKRAPNLNKILSTKDGWKSAQSASSARYVWSFDPFPVKLTISQDKTILNSRIRADLETRELNKLFLVQAIMDSATEQVRQKYPKFANPLSYSNGKQAFGGQYKVTIFASNNEAGALFFQKIGSQLKDIAEDF